MTREFALAVSGFVAGAAAGSFAVGFSLIADDVAGLVVVASLSLVSPALLFFALLLGTAGRHSWLLGVTFGAVVAALFGWFWIVAALLQSE